MTSAKWNALDRERQTFVLFAAVLAAIWGCIFLFSIKGLAFAEPGGFPAFYGAARLARANLPGLYSIELQNVFHPGNRGTGYFFHLPYEAALLIPLSYLPQVWAFVVWSVFNLCCLGAGAKILQRQFPDFGLLVPFAFAPTLCMLANGQDTAIVVLILAVGFDQFARGRELSSGAVLALGLFKFPLVVPLVAVLCYRHRRVLAGFIAASIPILAVCWAMVGVSGIQQYVAMTRGTDAKENPLILCTLRGLIGVISGGNHPVLCIGLSLALVVFAASLKISRISLFCVAVLVTLLVGWHCHLYDALVLIVPMAWMLDSKVKLVRWSSELLLAATPILLFMPLAVWVLGGVVLAQLGLLLAPGIRQLLLPNAAIAGEAEG
jgi:hypothetical protein